MNKFTLKLSVIVLMITFAENIHLYGQNTLIGVKSGINFVDIATSGNQIFPSYSYKPGMNIGISIKHEFNDKMGIQSDIQYVLKGGKFDYQNPGEEKVVTKNNFNYLSVPLLFKVHIFNNFSLETGPDFSYLISPTSYIN